MKYIKQKTAERLKKNQKELDLALGVEDKQDNSVRSDTDTELEDDIQTQPFEKYSGANDADIFSAILTRGISNDETVPIDSSAAPSEQSIESLEYDPKVVKKTSRKKGAGYIQNLKKKMNNPKHLTELKRIHGVRNLIPKQPLARLIKEIIEV